MLTKLHIYVFSLTKVSGNCMMLKPYTSYTEATKTTALPFKAK